MVVTTADGPAVARARGRHAPGLGRLEVVRSRAIRDPVAGCSPCWDAVFRVVLSEGGRPCSASCSRPAIDALFMTVAPRIAGRGPEGPAVARGGQRLPASLV